MSFLIFYIFGKSNWISRKYKDFCGVNNYVIYDNKTDY